MLFAHVGLFCADLEKLGAFYKDALGFQEVLRVVRRDAWIGDIVGFLDAELEILHLEEPSSRFRLELLEYIHPKRRPTARNAHIAFFVEDIEAAARRFEHCGGALMSREFPVVIPEGPNRGTKVAYFRDPEGNVVEFMQRPVGREIAPPPPPPRPKTRPFTPF